MYNGIYVILNQYIINLYIYVYIWVGYGAGKLKNRTRLVPIAGLHFSNPYQPLFVNNCITREKRAGAGRAPTGPVCIAIPITKSLQDDQEHNTLGSGLINKPI